MIKPEQAKEQLEKLQNKNWMAERIRAADGLAAGLVRDTARSVLGADEEDTLRDFPLVHRIQAEGRKKLLAAFQQMDAAARVQFFEAVAPALGNVLDRGWQIFDRLPYQSGYRRKPFRAPKHPEAKINRRLNWVLTILNVVGPYCQNITWFAAWSTHICSYNGADELGILLAAAVDAGGPEGEEVFQILCASGRNEHEIGGMGRHVTRALLTASRPDGWEFVEKLLLAAQREEGLRQAILETVDEAHPEAFRRMVKLILDENLARFSATVRAFDVWLEYRWEAAGAGAVNQGLEKLLLYLENSEARATAMKGDDAEQVYLALWSSAFEDAVGTVPLAAELLKHPKAEHRFVATHLLGQLGLVMSQKHLLTPLEDEDTRVTAAALSRFGRGADPRIIKLDLFERLEKLFARYPQKPEKLKSIVWPWTETTISRELVADTMPACLGERSLKLLIRYLNDMSIHKRAGVIVKIGEQGGWDSHTRETLFAMLGDASRTVRESALRQLAKCHITATEAASVENLLDRKSGDLRRGVLTLLVKQSDKDALASSDRLLAAKGQPQRLAGLELLRLLTENKRSQPECKSRAEQYVASHPRMNEAEQVHLDVLLGHHKETAKLDDALGLLCHDDRTWPVQPVAKEIQFHSPSTPKLIAALDKLVESQAQTVVSFKTRAGTVWQGLFSDISHGFPDPDPKLTVTEDRGYLPLADLWEKWWRGRSAELRDADGMEIPRAMAWLDYFCYGGDFRQEMRKTYATIAKQIFGQSEGNEQLKNWHVYRVLSWLLRLEPQAGVVEFTLNAAESSLALVPRESLWLKPEQAAQLEKFEAEIAKSGNESWKTQSAKQNFLGQILRWRSDKSPYMAWLEVLRKLAAKLPQAWTSEAHVRQWQLWRWVDEPVRPQETGGDSGISECFCLPRSRSNLTELARAHDAGGATDADVLDQLLGKRVESNTHYWSGNFRDLDRLSSRKPRAEYAQFKKLIPLVDRCRKRILELELTRGDNPTAASNPALNLSSIEGVGNLVAVLRALGKRNFVRGWSRDNQSMETVFSHLVRCCFPLPNETAEDFARQVKAAEIKQERLIELALYAPQWARFVEHALGWEMLTEAVWWIHAHTKGDDWSVDREIREIWEADMNSYTSLSPADLIEGGVDVAWFQRIYEVLGPKRWPAIDDAAQFASNSGGHARARLFANAMLGEIPKSELMERITRKRHQDSVRALGLLPLAGGKRREKDLLDRYKLIQEFRRGSKEFGSMRQASEKRAAQISQQNLARTAGYADPIRLEWAMEAKAVEDLADGPIEITVEDVKLSLGIDPWGEIEFVVKREGKILADIPAKLKKDPKVVALRARKVELKRQASRIRPSLEQFMVRGDEFSGGELRELMDHPLLAPMLKNLVIVGDGIMGYPVHDGQALESHDGSIEAIKADEKLRIAHPHDLLPAAKWHRWQKDCFARERIQPFKQVFRELYPLTEAEKKEPWHTRRYAGHQVQPRQALALLGQRGWVHHPEEGVRKVFHEAGLIVSLTFEEGFNTPAEVEGLTLEGAIFTNRKDGKPVKLDQLPPRLFSEAMRDLDLVVSVAHRGGVDPEASASTMEMRATLVEETTRLLKLKNVSIKDRYALIKGEFGEYSVHLGSAMTRKMPGEAVFIVAVHGQHRGRLFLPFADDDPRSAEVMSKVLLLARDNEIKDPNILDQIRR